VPWRNKIDGDMEIMEYHGETKEITEGHGETNYPPSA
jgi:hypothetical protein